MTWRLDWTYRNGHESSFFSTCLLEEVLRLVHLYKSNLTVWLYVNFWDIEKKKIYIYTYNIYIKYILVCNWNIQHKWMNYTKKLKLKNYIVQRIFSSTRTKRSFLVIFWLLNFNPVYQVVLYHKFEKFTVKVIKEDYFIVFCVITSICNLLEILLQSKLNVCRIFK